MSATNKYWNKSPLFENCSILKNVFNPNKCDVLLDKINHLRNNHDQHKEVTLTKFNYDKTSMNYYQFNFTDSDNFFDDFIEAYNFLLKIYKKNGFNSPWNSIRHCHQNKGNHSYFLNPQIFEYIPPSNFDWHLHKPKYQKFQLVINLSKRNRDYKSSLFEIMKDETSSWKITEEHKQGSIMSFPYDKPHRVTKIKPLQEKSSIIQRHVHLVMPIHPKEGFEGSFVYLNDFSNKYFPIDADIL